VQDVYKKWSTTVNCWTECANHRIKHTPAKQSRNVVYTEERCSTGAIRTLPSTKGDYPYRYKGPAPAVYFLQPQTNIC